MTTRLPPRHSPYPDVDDVESKMSGQKDPSSAAAMRRVALLIDGMARAAILPFGPRLVHRLYFHHHWYGSVSELDVATWSQIAFPMAILIVVFTLGRSLGSLMPRYLPLTQVRLPQHVARLGGIAFALHLYTFGAGLDSIHSLVVIRFLSALLTGSLSGIANASLPEDAVQEETLLEDFDEEEGLLQADQMRKRRAYVDVTPATAKIYMTGFCLSTLAGGLLYRHVATSTVLQAFTGGYQLTLSPLFFVVVSCVIETILRGVFLYSADGVKFDSRNNAPQSGNVSNRRVRISATAKDVPMLADIEEGFLTPIDDSQMEFFDPLSLSRHPDYQHRNINMTTPNRKRINSARSETSASDFFDCNSTLGDSEMGDMDLDPSDHADPSETALYQNGRCVYSNGSPAFVPQGNCIENVPQNYLDFCNGNQDKALKMYLATQEWRKEMDVHKIHTRHHAFYSEIKQAYPHFIHGYSKTGQAVVYEQPGKMNLKELFRSGCEISEMVNHYIFLMEYVGNCIGPRPEMRQRATPTASYDCSSWGTMVVMDVKGASLSSLSGDVVTYLTKSGAINSAHYPNALKRAFVVNSPFWLAGAWSGIKGILPESVHVDLVSASNTITALRQFIDDDQIPQEYGGSSPFPLGEHPYEQGLKELAHKSMEYAEKEEDMNSFNQCEERWVNDQQAVGSGGGGEVSEMSHGATWSTESAMASSPDERPIRRRLSSTDRIKEETLRFATEEQCEETGDHLDSFGSGGEILCVVSIMYTFWCAVQGAIETVVPLWLLSPAVLGGLGYAPSRSGMALFSASLALLWLMRTKVARVVSQIPNKAPMRAFRIGAGSEAALLTLLPLVPSFITSISRTDSVLIMASAIIFLACMALASMFGRSGVAILHRIASKSYSRTPCRRVNWLSRIYGQEQLELDCESGRFTWMLRLIGELLGTVVVAPLYCWSTSRERPAPFDASCAFFVASLVTFVLYVSSFSLHLNEVGEFAPHPRRENGCGSDVQTRRCCSFVGEVFRVSVGDMSSLLEEANWSSSPLLGYSRHQRKDLSSRRVAKIV